MGCENPDSHNLGRMVHLRAREASQCNASAPAGRRGAVCGLARNSPDHVLAPNESRDEAKPARTAAIYLRVSSDIQTTDNQEPDCLRLGKSQGWEVVEVYRERE